MALLLANIAFGINTAKLKIIDTAGCNLTIVEETALNTYSLKLTSDVHNWFSCVFNGLDTSNPTTFTLDMNTNFDGALMDLSKWEGLWPVYTYSYYWSYDAYVYYIKDDNGNWISSDLFLKDKLAGNGKIPIQNVIPAELAEEFLSEDETYWSAWQEIKDTKTNLGSNTFTITKQFHSPNAALSMRIPYTYNYMFEYISRLRNQKISGVTVHRIGQSIKQDSLYAVEISDPHASKEELKERRVVLMYANEDGSEPDGCWVINGAMNYLIQGIQNDDKEVKKILSEVTFLFIPMLDPVGWRNSTYGKLTYEFSPDDYRNVPRNEVINYAEFIIKWCGDYGYRLDVVCNFHNIECAEGPNVLFPAIESTYYDSVVNLKRFMLKSLQNVKKSDVVWIEGYMENRYMGWCTDRWGSISALFEINSRYPDNRLSLKDLNDLGKDFVLSFYSYFGSDEYERALPYIEKAYSEQIINRNKYINEPKKARAIPIAFYTLGMGW